MTLKERSRLLWRCRRGARELDSLLVPYGTARIRELNSIELTNLGVLLEQHDPDLLSWFLGRSVPEEPKIAAAVRDILAFRETKR
jgi:antitoxin CptB